MLSDIQIAQMAKMLPINQIADRMGIDSEYVDCYGKYKAKLDLRLCQKQGINRGKLILVTAISPTPAGEGKTTTTVGLGDAFSRLNKKVVIALREPSLGPVFGMKGGAAGGGYAQVVPMEDINLHFTGDIHAIGAANNLLAAMIDNHINSGNALGFDVRKITWRRCVDMNDRQLRSIIIGMGGIGNGIPREDGFDITVASEVMAILCLSDSFKQLKENLKNIVVGFTRDDKPITAGQLNAQGAMAALLKEAIKPNLVQTLENTPTLIHGGPFANIAHGCNSLVATKLALGIADYVITEAGFGADLGAEKFINIKCRKGNISPSAVVIVATVRALMHHGSGSLKQGMPNLLRHIENIKNVWGLDAIVAINKFADDTQEQIEYINEKCMEYGCPAVVSEVFTKGGDGAVLLAEKVLGMLENQNLVEPVEGEGICSRVYRDCDSIQDKIKAVATKIYRADKVEFAQAAIKQMKRLEDMGYGDLPVCIAKTQYSFSDDPKKLGAPSGFGISVRNVKLSAGAGFVVALTGNIMTLPGLPKVPAAEKIDINDDGIISGLF